jgi:hypothetical protein
MREHVQTMIAAEPAELVLDPVAQRVEDELSSQCQVNHEHGGRGGN